MFHSSTSASLVRARYMLRDLGTENVKSRQTRRLEISSSTGTLVCVTSSTFHTTRVRVVLFLGGEPFHRARRSVVDDGDEVFLFNLGRQAQDPRAFAVPDALLGQVIIAASQFPA